MELKNNPTLERVGNRVRIYKPEAEYTFVYKVHYFPQTPELLPERIDGFFLETGTPENYVEHPLKTLNEFLAWKPYRPLFDALALRRIPIYMTDVAFENTRRTLAVTGVEMILELAANVGPAMLELQALQAHDLEE